MMMMTMTMMMVNKREAFTKVLIFNDAFVFMSRNGAILTPMEGNNCLKSLFHYSCLPKTYHTVTML